MTTTAPQPGPVDEAALDAASAAYWKELFSPERNRLCAAIAAYDATRVPVDDIGLIDHLNAVKDETPSHIRHLIECAVGALARGYETARVPVDVAGLVEDIKTQLGNSGQYPLITVHRKTAERIVAALSRPAAQPSPHGGAEAAAQFLWKLLDDIDTVSDIAKSNDKSYRAAVEKIQRRRFEVGSTDGYTVTFKDITP